jgi:hypothetical protein
MGVLIFDNTAVNTVEPRDGYDSRKNLPKDSTGDKWIIS